MLRAAYHLGNRHVALELGADRLLLEPDHVLADMLRAMHLELEETQAAFEPEAGAYAAHESGAAHPHAQGRTPASTAAPVHGKPLPIGVALAPAPHVHGPGCKHEHGHHHR